MSEKLKPVRCGCGGEAHYEAYENYNFGSYIAHIMICDKCGMRTAEWPSEAEAIEAWNKAMGAKDINVPTKSVENIYSVGDHDKIYVYGFCPECGSAVIKPDKYCSECGCRLEW